MPDRSFGRKPAPTWMRPITERLSPTIRNLVIAEAVLFGLYVMAAPLRVPMTVHLALGPMVAAGEFWQPATALFVHLDLWSFVFDLIGLWFVGATIERTLGRRRFLIIFLGAGLSANVAMALLMAALQWPGLYTGCGDCVLALFVALGVLFGRAEVRVFGSLVLQARVLTYILVGMSVLSALLQRAWPSLAGTLVAVGVGYFLSGGKLGPILNFLTRWTRPRRSVLEVLEGGRGKRGKKYVN
jgi:membrane associated rhomboid family serine protease